MPNRYLREGFIESEAVNTLSWQAETFYLRLIVKVDDFGRTECSSKLLRAKLFPLKLEQVRDADVERWIAECEKSGLIRVYALDGKRYLQMNKWEKGRALANKFPPPPTDADRCLQMQTDESRCQPMHADVNRCMQMHLSPIPTPIPIPRKKDFLRKYKESHAS